jgi:hypothetical protein
MNSKRYTKFSSVLRAALDLTFLIAIIFNFYMAIKNVFLINQDREVYNTHDRRISILEKCFASQIDNLNLLEGSSKELPKRE